MIPNWKKICKTGEEIQLSAGEQKLDYVYIEDIIAGIIKAMQLLESVPQDEYYEKKYALSSDRVYTLKEIAAVFEQVYHTKLSIQWGKKPYRIREVMEPYRGLERLPGWEANYTLQTGFQKMYQSEYGNK